MSWSGWYYPLLLGVAYAIFSVGLGTLILGLEAGRRQSGDPDQRYRRLTTSYLGVAWLPMIAVAALHRSMFAPVVVEEAKQRSAIADAAADPTSAMFAVVVAVYLVWAVGVSIGASRLVFGWLRLRESIRGASATARCRRLGAGLDGLRVVETSTGESPFVAGLRRPVLVIPGRIFDSLSVAELGAVVRHEVAHLSRRDPLMVLIQRAFASLLWFNPALVTISGRLDRVREECCDRRACGSRSERLALAAALVRMGEMMVAPTSCHAGAATGSLALRVFSLTSPEREELPTGRQAVRTLLLSALWAAGTLWVGWQSGPVVRSLLPLSRVEAQDPGGAFYADVLAGRLLAVSIDSVTYRVEQQGQTARILDADGAVELSLSMDINGFRWSPRSRDR